MEDQSQTHKKTLYMMKYREKHKEEIKTQKKQYREIKTVCSCGMEIIKNNMARHLQTKKHTRLLEQQNQEETDQTEEA